MKPVLWLARQISNLRSGARRFPLTLFLILTATAAMLFINARQDFLRQSTDLYSVIENDPLTLDIRRTLLAAFMGVPLTLGLCLLYERFTVRLPIRLAGFAAALAGIAAYGFFLFPEMDMVSLSRYAMLTAVLIVLMLCSPHFFRREGLSLHVTARLVRGLVSALYSLVLMLSLFAILYTLDKLLGMEIKDIMYAQTAAVVWCAFAPTFWIAGMPPVDREPVQTDMPKTLRFLLLYILLPLLAVYTVILYAYALKIAVERVWPNGLVSSLMLSHATISLFVLFLIKPLRDTSKLANRFSVWFPRIALPLFVVLFLALRLRIAEYGFTESRWFSTVLAAWCFGAMLYAAVSKRPRSMIWALSLAIFAFLSVTGPLSAYDVSIRSQNARLETILARNGMLVEDRVEPTSKTVSEADRQQISDIVAWFGDVHGYDRARSLPADFRITQDKEVFGFELSANRIGGMESEYRYFESDTGSEATDISGYDRMFRLGYGKDAWMEGGPELQMTYDQQTFRLRLVENGETVLEENLADLFLSLVDRHGAEEKTLLPQSEMSMDVETDAFRVRIVLYRIEGSLGAFRAAQTEEEPVTDDQAKPELNGGYVEGIVLFSRK